ELHLQEKIRVYALAKELNLESKDLIDLCRQAGIEVKNQLSSLDPHQRDAVVHLVKQGGGGVAVAAPPKPASAIIPHVMPPVPVLPAPVPVRREPEPTKVAPPPVKSPPAPAAIVPPIETPAAPSPMEAPPPQVAPVAAELDLPESVEAAPTQARTV